MKHIYLLLLCCCILGAPLHAEQKAEPQKETVLEKADYKKAKAWYKKLLQNIKNATAALKKVKNHKHSNRALKTAIHIRKAMPGYVRSKTRLKNYDEDFDHHAQMETTRKKLKEVLTEERKEIVRENKTELKHFYNQLKDEREKIYTLISDCEMVDEKLVDTTTELYNTAGEIEYEAGETLRICVGYEALDDDSADEPGEGDFGSDADE